MGTRISERRRALHLTQEQLAERMDVTLQTVSCIELGKKAIRPQNLANLCLALDTSADYFLLGKRSEQDLSELLKKLTALSERDFKTVEHLINYLNQ